MSFLTDFTEKELKKWYKSQVRQRVKKYDKTHKQITDHSKQSLLNHDYWSAYDYGDVVRFVYIKSSSATKRPPKEGFFEDIPPKQKPQTTPTPKDEGQRFSNSISRSKARIFELASCNEFTHFCTFTQDQEKRDRFNLKEFRKDFAMLVRNLNRERDEGAKIKYLLIPEQHKDGAWHLHGLLKGLTDEDLRPFDLSEKLPERIRKQLAKGVKVYDWTRYRRAFGYFTCTEIDNQLAVSKYITKYISKDLQKTVREAGEHLFFASQGLNGRTAIVKNSIDKCPIEKWDFENKYIKVFELQIPRDNEGVSNKTDSEKYGPENLS